MNTTANLASSATSRIAVALAQIERDLFLRPEDFPERDDLRTFHFQPDSPEENTSDWESWLRETSPDILLTGWTTPPPPPSWLDEPSCPLRYICHLTGSVRRLVPRSFLERGGIVSNWGGIAAPAVAEHALLLALMALRNQRAWSQIIHHPDITRPPAHRLGTRTLHGRAIGIHGFGQVARELVKLLQPFGVSIRAYTNGLPPDAIQSHGITPADSLAGLFSQSEILFECEALTPSTAGSVTAGILARLPDGAVFVNVGRGLVVDEQALLRESADGRLRVALDVVSREPMDSRTPFLCHDAPILSPHIGGPTDDIHRECTLKAFANIDRYLSGLAPESIITPEIYDRST